MLALVDISLNYLHHLLRVIGGKRNFLTFILKGKDHSRLAHIISDSESAFDKTHPKTGTAV